MGSGVDHRPGIVTAAFLGLAQMKTHTHPQGRARPPGAAERELRLGRCPHRVRCPTERRRERITRRREHIPAVTSIASRRIASWTNNDADIASLSAAHNRVDPSTSVNKNVTVPDGNTFDTSAPSVIDTSLTDHNTRSRAGAQPLSNLFVSKNHLVSPNGQLPSTWRATFRDAHESRLAVGGR